MGNLQNQIISKSGLFSKKLASRIMDSVLVNWIYGFLVLKQVETMETEKLGPRVVYAESTNSCNANCITCPREKMTRKTGIMKIDLFKKIVSEAKDLGVMEIRLHNFGEPLLDLKISEKIEFAKKSGIKKVTVFTNASLLDKKTSEKIITAGIDKIFFSVDAANSETFEKIRKNLDYNIVEKNILNFCKIAKKTGKVKTSIAFTSILENQGEEEIFREKWKGIVDSIQIIGSHNWAGQKKIVQTKHKYKRKWPCPYLWQAMFVQWNGDVVICCEDFDSKKVLGNIKKSTVKEVWFGKNYRGARKVHKKKEFWKILPCNSCSLNVRWSIYDQE